MACARTGVVVHSRFRRAATAFSPACVEPWSPRKTMSRKPWSRTLRAADSSTRWNTSSGTVIVPRESHVAGDGAQAALGNVGDDRRDERVAERARDALGERLDARIVLAQRHVRSVLLGPADGHDDRRLPRLHERA